MNDYCTKLTAKLLNLHHLRPVITVDRKWVNMRCPFCGDSKKDYNKKRFYVKVEPEEGELPYFHCFNCGVGGPIHMAISTLFESDYDMESETNIYYKKMALNPKAKKYRMMKRKEVVISKPIARDYNVEKIHYINKRLGINLTMRDIVKYKIIIDLYQFLSENKVSKLTRNKNITDKMETDYVGFLSANNNCINMRNFRDSNKQNKYLKRYENYSVFGDDIVQKYYIISNTIDVMKDIDIIIAEGPFDIIGVYNHVYDKDDKNKIYVAVCGSGYLSLIKNLITDLGIIFCNIYIYSDNENDKDIEFYKELKERLGERINTMRVFYNKLGKDFGVTKDRIRCYGIKI